MLRKILLIFASAVFLGGCGSGEKDKTSSDLDKRPLVAATTTIIADIAKNLAGGRMLVESIMRPGEDPHIYDPRPNDARLISRARIVLTNGLHLEGTLDDIIRNNLAADGIHVALAEDSRIEPIESRQYKGAPDPHCWFSIPFVKVYTDRAMQALIQADPEGEQLYRENARKYLAALDSLDRYTREAIARIPPQRRVLVTAHDAFHYFSREYGIKVFTVIGISTDMEPRPRDLENLVSLINENKVPAVFIETSVSASLNNLVRKVSQKSGAAIGGVLYSDSLGEQGGPAGTFLEMFGYNVKTITESLM